MPLRLIAAMLALILLALCGLGSAQAQTTQATSITLPDGTVCQIATSGQPLSFQGQTASYTCSDGGVLLGSPTQQNGNLNVNRGKVENGQITAAAVFTFQIARVDLVDGSICTFAGDNAVVVGGQRVNFNCGSSTQSLLGDFNTSQPLWTADKVNLQGNPPTVQSRQTLGIGGVTGATSGATPTPALTPTPTPAAATSIRLPDGTLCQWSGSGATVSFNGQRVNYNCGARSDGGTTVILGIPTFQNNVWQVNVGIVDLVGGQATLRSSQTQSMVFGQVTLVDGTICTWQGGTSSTPTVENRPLNYTCGRPEEGLLGDFTTSQPLWTAVKVVLGSTLTVQQRQTIGITTVSASVPSGQSTSFILPDGTRCDYSATALSPPLSFNGQPANYTCSNPALVIVGAPTLQNGVWIVSLGNLQTVNGTPTIVSTTNIQMDLAHVMLADGSNCNFAGTGATIAVGNQRLNYTCGDPSTGLLGDFNTSQPLWTAQKVVLQQTSSGSSVQSQTTVDIVNAFGATPSAQPGPTATPTPASVAAPPQTRDERYFPETNFRIGSDDFWTFFQSRGGVDTFGFPVSRVFGFLGCPVQIFQRSILQQCGSDAPVALLNLLDPGLFPYTRVNGSVFPGPDDALKASTPLVGSPDYDEAIIQFVNDVAPDTWNGQPVNFLDTFNSTGGLEIWGAPISNPAYDPTNPNFVYQRFQRGVMHYASGQGTRGILLADYLKAIMLGPQQAQKYGSNLPADLNEEARTSTLYSQYCPGQNLWLCRAQDMPGSDLTDAFEPN
jgi:hypothetical protein